jgi:hypothetical protein
LLGNESPALSEAAHRSLRPAASAYLIDRPRLSRGYRTSVIANDHSSSAGLSGPKGRPARAASLPRRRADCYERGNALLHVPDLLAHRIDGQLEIARILLNGFERGFADFQRDVDFRPGRDLMARTSTIAAIAKSVNATAMAALQRALRETRERADARRPRRGFGGARCIWRRRND